MAVMLRLKLTSKKLILAKISNKRPLLKVEVVGAYLIIFLIGWVLIQAERLLEGTLIRGLTVFRRRKF